MARVCAVRWAVTPSRRVTDERAARLSLYPERIRRVRAQPQTKAGRTAGTAARTTHDGGSRT